MLRFSLLGSGSSGNALYLASDTHKLLIDNGLTFRELTRRLGVMGAAPEELDAVLVTHEHGDHVGGIGTLARRCDVPVFITPDTAAQLPQRVGPLPKVQYFTAGDSLRFGDLEVESFPVAHDAADPVSFVAHRAGARLGLATEMGHVSHLVRQRLAGVQALVLESNYCPDMLLRGQYPPRVQQRIRSRVGHLSNQSACSLLAELRHDGLRTVVLVHISENNNTPDLVRRMVTGAMAEHPAEVFLASQDAPTPLFEVVP